MHLLFMVIGLIVLIAGAEGLVRGASSIAKRLGLPQLFIGLTVVAIGTSTPELVVSLVSALQQRGDISIGNVVGSNIFNIAVILGLTAIISPIKVSLSIIKVDIPVMITVTIAACYLIAGGPITFVQGAGLLLTLTGYFFLTFNLAKRFNPEDTDAAEEGGGIAVSDHWAKDIVYLIAGITALVLGGKWLVESAVEIALALKIPNAVVSLVAISAGTSLPELATSLVAALRGKPDMAVGNAVGSNIFNILAILGISSLLTPLSAPGIHLTDLAVMLVFAVLLFPLAFTDRKVSRVEGTTLLFGYSVYIVWLLMRS